MLKRRSRLGVDDRLGLEDLTALVHARSSGRCGAAGAVRPSPCPRRRSAPSAHPRSGACRDEKGTFCVSEQPSIVSNEKRPVRRSRRTGRKMARSYQHFRRRASAICSRLEPARRAALRPIISARFRRDLCCRRGGLAAISRMVTEKSSPSLRFCHGVSRFFHYMFSAQASVLRPCFLLALRAPRRRGAGRHKLDPRSLQR